jgi:hypothetical protein
MLIHKATKKQIKEEYVTDEKIQSVMKKMEKNLEEIESIFNNLDFKILDKPDGMFFTGFTWKLSWKEGEQDYIFDILFSDRRFSIYITNVKLIPKGEEQNYHNSNIPSFNCKKFEDWLQVKDLKEFLNDIVTVFLQNPIY